MNSDEARRNLTDAERQAIAGPGLQNVSAGDYLSIVSAGMMAIQEHDPQKLRQIIDALETARWRDQESARHMLWIVGILSAVGGAFAGMCLWFALRSGA